MRVTDSGKLKPCPIRLESTSIPLATEVTLRRKLVLLAQRMTLKFGAMIVAAVGVMIAVLRVPH